MEDLKKRKKYLILLFLFFLFLFFCSVIAKGIYASGLPQVEVATGIKRTLSHDFYFSGSITEGEESALYVLNGLRVDKVFVRVGDHIEEGDILFQIDTLDLAEQMETMEQEMYQLKLQIKDLQKNQELDTRRRELQKKRAQEDYDLAYAEGVRQIQEAANALQAASMQLEEHKKNKPAAPSATVSGSDLLDYEQTLRAWENTKRQLEENVNSLASVKANTERTQNSLILSAARTLEDANLPSAEDSTLELSSMRLDNLKEAYEKYQKILDCDGNVASETQGTLTALNVRVGERTIDGPAAKITDDEAELIFKTYVGKEEYNFICQGDEGVIEFSRTGKKEKVRIDYLAENEYMPGTYEILSVVPGSSAAMGESGVLSIKKQSESYACCIPVEALHMDDTGKYYIYMVAQKESILGTQYIASAVRVNVLDQNEMYAAIDASLVDEKTEIITSSTKEIHDGSVVRYKEW